MEAWLSMNYSSIEPRYPPVFQVIYLTRIDSDKRELFKKNKKNFSNKIMDRVAVTIPSLFFFWSNAFSVIFAMHECSWISKEISSESIHLHYRKKAKIFSVSWTIFFCFFMKGALRGNTVYMQQLRDWHCWWTDAQNWVSQQNPKGHVQLACFRGN